MGFILKEYEEKDTVEILKLWNAIVKSVNAFPQETASFDKGKAFL